MDKLQLIAQLAFWISIFLLTYHLFGYGLVLWILNRIFRRNSQTLNELTEYPTVSIICPAFNEERDIEAKIISYLNLDYPAEKLKLLVISDDSTDATNSIVESYKDQRVQLLVQKPRQGKQAAHNLALAHLDSDFVLSTDATAIFEPQSLKLLMREMLSDPRIGLVSGKLKLVKGSGRQSGEGLYIKYESFLRDLDSRFHSVLVAVGALFLIRRELFGPIDVNSADDFERTLFVLNQGFKAKFVGEAAVVEEETEHATEELARKVRIITQEWYCVQRNLGVLNPFKHPAVSWMLFSHKILRWLFFLPVIGIWVSLGILSGFHNILGLLFIFLTIALILGAWELSMQRRSKHIPLMGLPAYFVAMLIASIAAFGNYLRGKKYGVWDTQR